MESRDLIQLILAAYKDKVQQDCLERLKEGSILLWQAEASARRAKAKECILAMAKLKTELLKFKATYQLISKEYGSVIAIDEYIKEINSEINRLSYAKNHSLYK